MRIDRDSLARFAALRLRAPGPATSLQQGDRRSPFLGRGLEFADYREYDPADDIRLIDWNVYLRLGVALVRQFNEERSLTLEVCVDVSESMAFGDPSKADHAAQLAAALSVVALAHRDPVGLCCYGGDRRPVRRRAVNLDGMPELLHVLENVQPGGRGDPYAQIASQLPGRSDRVVLLSDLLLEEDARESVLRLLAASSRHPMLLHVLGEDDLRPDLREVARVIDSETGEEIAIADGVAAAREYQAGLQRFIASIEARCRTLGIRYVPAYTERTIQELVQGDLRRAQIVEQAAGGV